MRLIVAIATLALLSSCTAAEHYTDVGIRTTISAKDTEAKVAKRVPCIISIGSLVRMPVDEQDLLTSYAKRMCPTP